MRGDFMKAADADEREAMDGVAHVAIYDISNEVLRMVQHLFGAAGTKALRDIPQDAVQTEIRNIVEHAVESAYYAGGKHAFDQSQRSLTSALSAALRSGEEPSE